MRIISGSLKKTKLKDASHITSTRPTTDRTREALFNIIASRYENLLQGHFVDLFAGTGSVGLEAFSRGASHITFVENNKFILPILFDNISHCKAENRTSILKKDASTPPAITPAIDILFMDPPYHTFDISLLLQAYSTQPFITQQTLWIFQCAKDETLTPPSSLSIQDHRSYGYNDFYFLSAD